MAAAVLAVACSAGPTAPASTNSHLIANVSSLFHLNKDLQLDLAAAATATPATPALTRAELTNDGFAQGAERIWTAGAEYVTVIELDVADEGAAKHLVDFEIGQLTSTRAAVTYTPEQPKGAKAFSFYGTTRAGARTIFCQGVWFAIKASAYEVTDCDPQPRAANLALDLAQRQAAQAAR